jgi:aldehyde dehydrogenase (NAD+)
MLTDWEFVRERTDSVRFASGSKLLAQGKYSFDRNDFPTNSTKFTRAAFPEALTAVFGAREVVTKLLELPFDFMFLTGSVGAGKAVMRAAAEHLTPVLLELGGQNPAIVDETANLPDAAKKIVWGAMAWGGQWCTSPGYAVVHESVAEEFVADCKKAVVELYGTDPKSNPDYSRIISTAAVNRLASLIDPKKVVYGGKFDAPARYLDPTILYPISWSDKIMEDEIFGPLLPILIYSDLGELLAKIKSLPKPLAGYVFSRDQRAIDRVLQSLSFGGGAVNQTNIFLFTESMPYGGVGTSGIGNYYGKYGYDSLTHAKSVLISPPDVAIDHLLYFHQMGVHFTHPAPRYCGFRLSLAPGDCGPVSQADTHVPPYTQEKVQALNQWFDY